MTADIYKEKDSNLNVTLKIFTLQKAAHVNIKKSYLVQRGLDGTAHSFSFQEACIQNVSRPSEHGAKVSTDVWWAKYMAT